MSSAIEKKFGYAGKKGRKGEKLVLERVQTIYDQVIDYTQDMSKQRQGIDFSIRNDHWSRECFCDAKANMKYKYGKYYIYLELYKGSGKEGWLYKSKSDRIYHIDIGDKSMVYYDRPQMSNRIKQLIDDNKVKPRFSEQGDGFIVEFHTQDKRISDLLKWVWNYK
jgi:hypothetical protein